MLTLVCLRRAYRPGVPQTAARCIRLPLIQVCPRLSNYHTPSSSDSPPERRERGAERAAITARAITARAISRTPAGLGTGDGQHGKLRSPNRSDRSDRSDRSRRGRALWVDGADEAAHRRQRELRWQRGAAHLLGHCARARLEDASGRGDLRRAARALPVHLRRQARVPAQGRTVHRPPRRRRRRPLLHDGAMAQPEGANPRPTLAQP